MNTLPRLVSRLALVAATAHATACGPRLPATDTPADAADPGPIRPPADMPFEFQWRQHVTASWPTGEQGFEAVLLHHQGRLQLVGLSPMGMPGFVLTLEPDAGVTFENRTRRELPFPPEHILADVERVFFPWLERPPAGFEGEREGTVLGLRVHELWNAGRLSQRSFVRVDEPERGRVRIDYEGWSEGQDAPAKVVLENEWFDYTLTIETLEQTRLD